MFVFCSQCNFIQNFASVLQIVFNELKSDYDAHYCVVPNIIKINYRKVWSKCLLFQILDWTAFFNRACKTFWKPQFNVLLVLIFDSNSLTINLLFLPVCGFWWNTFVNSIERIDMCNYTFKQRKKRIRLAKGPKPPW